MFKRRIAGIIVVILVFLTIFPHIEANHTFAAESYNVADPHIIINQIYGANADGYVSHSFIELYNPTDLTVNFDGWSVNYCSSQKGGVTEWQQHLLSGEIKAHTSYLIRCGSVSDTKNVKLNINNFDDEWNQVLFNKGVSVVLLSQSSSVGSESVFDNDTMKPSVNGYVDMLSAAGDGGTNEEPAAYEKSVPKGQTKKKAIRRMNFCDTDNNEDDAEFVDYTGDYSSYQPRSQADGEWGVVISREDILNNIAAEKALIPKYYSEYCTDDSIEKIEAAYALAAGGLDNLSDDELSDYLAALKAATGSLRYKSFGTLDQFFITTDKGGGESYGSSLTKRDGYVNADIVLTDKDGLGLISDNKANIKIRGNLTSGGAKKPYNIKFSSKQNLFGFGKSKKWVLLADYYDPTLMRNNQALDLGQKIGASSVMDHKRVEVWVDGQFRGLYLLTEKIEADKNRVDIDPDNGDFLVELDAPGRTEEGNKYFYTDSGYYFRLREPDEDECSDDQLNAAQSTMNRLEEALKSGDYNEIEKIINVNSFVEYYLLNEFMQTSDFGGLSVYFYFDESEDKFYAGPPWDFDLTGNAHINTAGSPRQVIAAKSHYFKLLMQQLSFKVKVKKRWDETKDIYRDSFTNGGWFEEQFNNYGEAINRDVALWGVKGGYMVPAWGDYDTVISDYRAWQNERFNWLDEYLTQVTTGIFKENNGLYYYVSGNRISNAGLIQIDDDYFYVGDGGKVLTGENYVDNINAMRPDGKGKFPVGTYFFDDTGRMIVPVEYEIITKVPGVAPSCIVDGCKDYWIIKRTGKIYDSSDCSNEVTMDSLVIPAVGHNYVKTIVPPTPLHQGYTLYECENCGDAYKDTFTDATGRAVAEVPATCSESGIKGHYIDTATGKLYSDPNYEMETTEKELIIPAKGHSLIHHFRVEATETTDGNIEYWECSECHKYFSDYEGKIEISKEQTVIPAKGNEKNNPTNWDDISNPYSTIHATDGSYAVEGSISRGNAKWTFDAEKSETVVVVKQVDASKRLEYAFSNVEGYDSRAKHRYKVDDKSKANINKKGVLKLKKGGEINIQMEQWVKGSGWIKIGNPVHFYIQLPEMRKRDNLSLSEGSSFDAFRYLGHTTYRPNKWISSKPSVASVDPETGIITIHKNGNVKIIAEYGEGKSGSGKKYATKLKVKM